jgi:hypothetical protein
MRGRRGVLLACLAVVVICIVALSATRGDDAPATPTVEPVAAEQGTPAAGASAAGCVVTPRPESFLVTLVEAPDPDVTPTPIAGVPDGVPADATTSDDVGATVAALIACTNAGELLRAYALFDDAYLRRLFDPEGAMSAEIANELVVSFATPEPVAADRRTVLVGPAGDPATGRRARRCGHRDERWRRGRRRRRDGARPADPDTGRGRRVADRRRADRPEPG